MLGLIGRVMDGTTDDASLVQAARDGDREAFAQLLTRHWSLLLSVCRRMLANEDLAYDVAQEATLQAFLSLDRLKRAEQFGSWLSGIGLNICRHRLRRHERLDLSWEAVVGGRHAPERDIPDESLGPEERAEVADLRARVQRAVADLPRGQRAAVVLFYLLGLTHAETAAHLGIEVGTLKTRLHKARGTLRRRLWELWEDQEMVTPTEAPLIEMRIESVRKDADDPDNRGHHVMVLEEVAGSRYLLIWIGEAEGFALANALGKLELPRPMTIAFMANVLQATGTTLREVHVSKLVGDVFYATALIDGQAGPATVDARPSDALTLATIMGAPIRVAQEVLDAAGVTIEKKTVQDEHGRDVIEQTARNVSTGEDVERIHLDPQTLAPIRVLFRRPWTTDQGSEATHQEGDQPPA